MKYVIIAVIAVAIVVIGIVVVPQTHPSLNELLARTSNNTYTASYSYYIYYNILNQNSKESGILTYSQKGITDRYIFVISSSYPQMGAYMVTAKLSNGTTIFCTAGPTSAGCSPINQTFNLISLMLPIINYSKFTYAGTQKLLGYNAYCYISRNSTTLGSIMPIAIEAGLGSLPINIMGEVCMTQDGIPLLIELSMYGSSNVNGQQITINMTQVLQATSVQDGTYLVSNATSLLNKLGINATG